MNRTRLNSLEKVQALLNDRGWGMPVKSIVLEKPVETHQLEPHPWTQVDPTRFPHTCPRCGAPAYVGLASVECSDGCV